MGRAINRGPVNKRRAHNEHPSRENLCADDNGAKHCFIDNRPALTSRAGTVFIGANEVWPCNGGFNLLPKRSARRRRGAEVARKSNAGAGRIEQRFRVPKDETLFAQRTSAKNGVEEIEQSFAGSAVEHGAAEKDCESGFLDCV